MHRLSVVSALLLLSTIGATAGIDQEKPATGTAQAADALWSFNTHG